MSNKTRSIIKVVAILIVLLAVSMRLGWVAVYGLNAYQFWLVVIGFAMSLFSSR